MVDEVEAPYSRSEVSFPNIFRSFRMAIQPSKLVIAFAAVTAICLTGWLMDLGWSVVLDSPPYDPARTEVFRPLWTTVHD